MISSDFRAEARKKLSSKWAKAACISLAYGAIFFLINFLKGFFSEESMTSFVISILTLVIEIPLSFGLVYAFMNLFQEKEVTSFDFLGLGFDHFGKSWGVTFHILLEMILPIILTIVSYFLIIGGLTSVIISGVLSSTYDSVSSIGTSTVFLIIGTILFIVSMIWSTMKGYYYQLSYFIAIEHPEMSSKDVVEKSKTLMTNQRGKLFCLQFSFIGWAILAVFTLGIGFLWLVPYIQFATMAFYKFISKSDSVNDSTPEI